VKAIRVSEGIVPLGEFKAQAARLIKELKDEAAPLVITQNGRPAAVMLSPRAYDELRERQEFIEAVAAGLADAVAGRVVDHDKVARWLSSWGTDAELEPPL
jgi:prevent-host-death family protein